MKVEHISEKSPVQQGLSMHCATERETAKVKVKEKDESEAKKVNMEDDS